jgi:hypothetical protein
MYLRQVCLVARTLEPAIKDLTRVLGIDRCYVDPGVGRFGLENTLMAVGSNFLEVVAPIQENTAAGRFLQKRGGDGGYILVCQVDSAEHQQQCRDNAASLDVRVAYESSRGSYHLMQLHPADLKNAMWEIDWDDRAEMEGVWEPAGGTVWKQHVRDDVTFGLTGVELQADDPALTAKQWGAIAGIEAEAVSRGFRLPLENGELRFVEDRDGRGPGLAGVDLAVRNGPAIMDTARAIDAIHGDCIELCGTRFYLRDVD